MKEYLKNNKGLLLITVFLSAVCSIASSLLAVILQKLIDIAVNGDKPGFYNLLLIMVLYVFFLGVSAYLYSYFSKLFVRNITFKMRKKVFEGIMKKSPRDYASVNTADYISMLTNDVKLTEENYIIPLLSTIEYSVLFLSTLVILLTFSPIVTIFLIICIALMYIIPSLFGTSLQKRQDDYSRQLSAFTVKLKDIMSGYEIIRAFNIVEKIKQQYQDVNNDVTQAKFKADKLFAVNESISGILSALSVIAVVFISAYLVLIGNITVGTLLALVQLSSTFVTPILMIMQNIPKMQSIKPVLNRMNEFVYYDNAAFSGKITPVFNNVLQMDQVGFSYSDNHKALQNINIEFKKRRKYAITGQSGCGKTTLIRLMTAYDSEYSGSISFDNYDIRQLDIEKLNKMISVIHQNVYMFDTDIRENICLYQNYSEQELNEVLDLSGIRLFLDQLPNGLNTPVGENGANLSGGQRQRIAVARALIQKTPILILDEGTSAIDMQTAYDIEKKLLAIEDLTLITITHNMSEDILGMYDQIIYMENGHIAETGNLSELLSVKEGFYSFFTLK